MDRVFLEVFQASLDRKIADDYVDGLLEKIDNKAYFPDSWIPLHLNDIHTRYRYVIYKAYVAFYYIEGEKMCVDRILFSKSDYIKKLSIH